MKKIIKKLADLRVEYSEIVKETFEEPERSNFICPTCKQSLPGENIEKQIQVLEINFNADKKTRLDDINKTGKDLGARVKALQTLIDNDKGKSISNEKTLDGLYAELEAVTNLIEQEEMNVDITSYKSDERYQSLEDEIKTLEIELESNETEEVDSSDLD